MTAPGWRFRVLLGLLVNGSGLAILIDQALTQVLR